MEYFEWPFSVATVLEVNIVFVSCFLFSLFLFSVTSVSLYNCFMVTSFQLHFTKSSSAGFAQL